MATEQEVVGIVARLVAAYPNANVTDLTIAVYVEDLRDIDAAVLALAARKVRTDCKFFPTIAELREAANAITTPVLRSGQEAWGDVLRYFSRRERPADPLVEKAVEAIGGWRYIGASDEGSLLWPFVKAYEAIRDREHNESRQLPEVLQAQQMLANGRREDVAQLTAGIGRAGQ